jgi:hypothetical protein
MTLGAILGTGLAARAVTAGFLCATPSARKTVTATAQKTSSRRTKLSLSVFDALDSHAGVSVAASRNRHDNSG